MDNLNAWQLSSLHKVKKGANTVEKLGEALYPKNAKRARQDAARLVLRRFLELRLVEENEGSFKLTLAGETEVSRYRNRYTGEAE